MHVEDAIVDADLGMTSQELMKDLLAHYFSAYPFLLVVGAWRRWKRRMASIWLPKSPGRPPVPLHFQDLILDMKRENPGWGGQRISDELKLMGIKVSKKSVLRILKENGFTPPTKKFDPPSWTALWDCYRRIWGIDFLTVFDVRGKQLFVFNVIDWCTRSLMASSVTSNPTREWLTQQFRNISIETDDTWPEAIVRDNDGIYGKWLDKMLEEDFGVDPIPIPIKSPWENGRTERFNKSEKMEALTRIPIADESHCPELASKYRRYYNKKRPHQALGGQTPNETSSKILGKGAGEVIQFVKKPDILPSELRRLCLPVTLPILSQQLPKGRSEMR